MQHEVEQPDTARVRHTGTPNFSAMRSTDKISLMLASRAESNSQKSIAPALEHLFEQHPVHPVLPGGDTDRLYCRPNRCMAQHIIRALRFSTA